jgi:hypothetical protein
VNELRQGVFGEVVDISGGHQFKVLLWLVSQVTGFNSGETTGTIRAQRDLGVFEGGKIGLEVGVGAQNGTRPGFRMHTGGDAIASDIAQGR